MNRTDLINQLVVNHQAMYSAMARKHDSQHEGSVSGGQRAAFITIALNDRITVKQLAEALYVTSGAATQHIEALVQSGLVERVDDAKDRRSIHLILSKAGKAKIKQIKQDKIKQLEELFKDVSDKDLITYNKVMTQVSQKIKSIGEKGDKHV